ncbi:MAG TPA: HlyD family efflux transporter periplasmic adaptor subunit [Azospirillaceae bacterium]|nr:HlyD family efflux transporter periplasmic adaptor subunit [Azospirillaceae bacterium]
MTFFRPAALRASLLAILLAFAPASVLAHAGEDHGEEAPAAAAPTGTPTVEAVGSEFEVVGILRDGHLVLWVDRFLTNEPVTDAAVEVSVGGAPAVAAAAEAGGIFVLDAPWAGSPGDHELVFTIAAGDTADLLAGTLRVPSAEAETAGAGIAGGAWPVAAGALGIGLLAVGGIAVARRHRTAVAAALVGAGAVAGWAMDARAHGADDHEHAAPAAGGPVTDAPRRLPDGTVFVPKRTQRLLEVRTVQAQAGAARRTVSIVGRVVPDPNFAGLVQAGQPGRVEPAGGGLPRLGQKVVAGQVLAYIVPVVDTVERGDVQERIAEVEKNVEIARRRVARLTRLQGVVAQRDIDDAMAELAGLQRQREALNPTLARREELRAPVSGIISAANATPGQVIDDRDAAILFEIVDPSRLVVEALSFDPAIGDQISAATAVADNGANVKLVFAGRGPARREAAVPLLFEIEEPVPGMGAGTPVRVHVQTEAAVEGMVLPRDALVRGGDGLPMVWDHASPQRFVPRPVRFQPLDGGNVVVLGGVEPGARIVTQGAALLSQVR